MTAALGIVLDPEELTMKFFGGTTITLPDYTPTESPHHTSDILCININNTTNLAATGQLGTLQNPSLKNQKKIKKTL
jgi:hypothetical protein